MAHDFFLADTGGKKRTVYVQELGDGDSCFQRRNHQRIDHIAPLKIKLSSKQVAIGK